MECVSLLGKNAQNLPFVQYCSNIVNRKFIRNEGNEKLTLDQQSMDIAWSPSAVFELY